jgi:hypothetical protein
MIIDGSEDLGFEDKAILLDFRNIECPVFTE